MASGNGYAKTRGANTYVAVAASQTASRLTSGIGTRIARMIIVPASVDAGDVTLIDGTGSGSVTMKIFDGATSGLTSITPIVIELDAQNVVDGSTGDGWFVTTGADVSIIAIVQPG